MRITKAIIMFLLLLPTAGVLCAENPFFGEYQNQISFHAANYFSMTRGTMPLYHFELSYSQPNEFFRLPGRKTITAFGVTGEKGRGLSDDDNYYDNLAAGIAQEVYLLSYKKVYLGAGLGIYIRARKTESIGSNITFGEKVFLGYRPGRFYYEVFAKHYSNGGLQENNKGENYMGLAVGYNF